MSSSPDAAYQVKAFRFALRAKSAQERQLVRWSGQLIAVHPAYTSQSCSACGHCEKDNRKSQSLFVCMACGHQANADINAARNILAAALLAAGHAASACGEVVRHRAAAKQTGAASVKQEPTEALKLVQETELV